MAHVQYIDELIREYLVFRGFAATLKSFDTELRHDKVKSFRVDRIIDQIMQFITSYELQSIREFWSHLDTHIFNRLETHFITGVKKLENAVLKLYLVNAAVNNKTDRIMEFFIKMTVEIQNQAEWKDWMCFPFVKNHEDNPTFSLHFTKQWQDTLLVSLHNLLAMTFQYMPMPTLLHFEEDANKMNKLEQKNESLRSRLAMLIDKRPEINVNPCQVDPPPPILDDFYIIAQESNTVDNQIRGFRTLIKKSIGGGVSPVMGRKDTAAKKRAPSASRSTKSSQFYD